MEYLRKTMARASLLGGRPRLRPEEGYTGASSVLT
jgi:hypothetical protein